jgi:HEPN domain-containing protein
MTPPPKSGERQFDREYAKTLIQIAIEDLQSARGLRKSNEGRRENVVFLVQQAIEKAIKAVICHQGLPVPLVRELGALVARLPANLDVPHGYDLLKFNDYAGILRYERGHGKLTTADLDAALAAGADVVDWAQKQIP